jgi:hypothetical protein
MAQSGGSPGPLVRGDGGATDSKAFDSERAGIDPDRALAAADTHDLDDVDEFIRRFLIHVLPDGFHRIRHYGLFANANRAGNIALARRLLGVPDPARRHAKTLDLEAQEAFPIEY